MSARERGVPCLIAIEEAIFWVSDVDVALAEDQHFAGCVLHDVIDGGVDLLEIAAQSYRHVGDEDQVYGLGLGLMHDGRPGVARFQDALIHVGGRLPGWPG